VIIAFNHTSFTVASVERAVRFWQDTLGFQCPGIVTRTSDWVEKVTGVPGARIRVAHLYGYGHHMEFIEYIDGPRTAPDSLPDRPGIGHVCLEVDDIETAWHALMAAGASELGQITAIVDPAMKPCRVGYIRDPNGVIIELLEPSPVEVSA